MTLIRALGIPTTFLPLFRDEWHNRIPPMIDILLQPVKHGGCRGSFGSRAIFHDPGRRQQLPQYVGEAQSRSIGPIPVDHFVNDSIRLGAVDEWRVPR